MNMLRTHKNTVGQDEKGFASIVIALILIIVLALLTVGFAELSRHEQQNALDAQLGNQAYYAAESGVNDAYNAVKSSTLNSQLTLDSNTCYGPSTPIPGTSNNIVDSNSGTQYTCVLINQTPTSLVKDVNAYNDWVTAFNVPSTPATMKLEWISRAKKAPSTDSQHKFTAQGASWNHPAVIQFSVTPLNNLDRNSLESNTYTVYMYPSTDSPATNPSYSTAGKDQGQIVPGHCSNSGDCSVTISGGFPAGVTTYLIHAVDYYDDSSLIFTSTDVSAHTMDFSGSQAVIDSTGQDKNVLRRIEVHVPIFPENPQPSAAIESQNVCKRFLTYPTGGGTSQNQVQAPSGTNVPAGFDMSSCNLN